LARVHRSGRINRPIYSALPLQKTIAFAQPWQELILIFAVFLLPAGVILINHSPQTPGTDRPPGSASIPGGDVLDGWLGGFRCGLCLYWGRFGDWRLFISLRVGGKPSQPFTDHLPARAWTAGSVQSARSQRLPVVAGHFNWDGVVDVILYDPAGDGAPGGFQPFSTATGARAPRMDLAIIYLICGIGLCIAGLFESRRF